MVRPGERWGVDTNTVFGTNQGRALGSVFGGVHVNPDVDVFGGGTYSTQENYRDGTGYEVANTGNRLSAGLGKLTVRPADGHEVKLGAIFQEDLYSVGQPPRPRGRSQFAPIRTGPTVWAVRRSTRPMSRTTPRRSAGNIRSPTTSCSTGTPRFTGIAPTTTRSRPGTQARRQTSAPVARRARQSGLRLYRRHRAVTCSIPSASTSTTRRASKPGILAPRRHLWRRCLPGQGDDERPARNTPTSPPRAARARFPAASCSGRPTTPRCSRWSARSATTITSSNSGTTSSSGDRLSPKITVGLMPTAIVTPYVSYAEGYRAPSITETLVDGPHAAAPAGSFFRCPSGTPARRHLLLLRAQSEPAAGGRQEQGDRLQREEERPVRCGRQFPRQVQRVPQRCRGLHRSGQLRPTSSFQAVRLRAAVPRSAVLPVPEHCPGQDRGLRSRDDVRRH